MKKACEEDPRQTKLEQDKAKEYLEKHHKGKIYYRGKEITTGQQIFYTKLDTEAKRTIAEFYTGRKDNLENWLNKPTFSYTKYEES